MYNRALILNEDCESVYALEYIEKWIQESWLESMPRGTGQLKTIEQELLDLFNS
jgi:hypothetical protein